MEKCICGKEFKNKISLGAHHANCKVFQEEKERKLKILKIEEQDYQFICNCGKRYKEIGSLRSHARFCNQYVKMINSGSKYFNNDTSTYICECGYETKNYQSLNGHFGHCQLHRNIIGKEFIKYNNPNFQKYNFKNISKEDHLKISKKGAETLKQKYETGELIPYFQGKHHTEETKEKIRKARYEYLSDGKQHGAFINGERSYIEQVFVDIINNNHLYENFDIVEQYCGVYPYFLDFALPNLKIDIELDGKFHENQTNIEHDIKRTEVLNNNGWKVIRYKYDAIMKKEIEFQNIIIELFNSLQDIKHHHNNKIYTYKEYKDIIKNDQPK